jgi:hypothetical protein
MKEVLMLLAAAVLAVGVQPVVAAECVEVDIELNSQVTVGGGSFGEGFFELTNCGDEATLLSLTFSIDLGIGQPFEIGPIRYPLGAGETVSREFRFPAPPIAVGKTVTFCVTAVSGEAEATDCATVAFVGEGAAGGDLREFALQIAASSNECIELDLEISDTVYTTPGDFFADAYYELTNCGDTAVIIQLEVGLSGLPIGNGLASIPVLVGAGETLSREFRFPVPPAVPAGDYTISVTATAGSAVVSAAEIITVIKGTYGGSSESPSLLAVSNHPNPFNPSTTISFVLPKSGQVSVEIYNLLGQNIRTLVANETLAAGQHSIEWDGTDGNGTPAASGMYFYRMSTGNEVVSRKMVLVK